MRSLLATKDDIGPTIARLTLGLIYFPHGAQKVFGWFGGYGFSGTMGFMTGQMHIPMVFAVLAIAAEFLGSLGLIIGFLGRVAAFGIACNMMVAVLLIHSHFGFFANWTGQQKGEGIEFHLLAIGLAILVMVKGSGAASVDLVLTRQMDEAGATTA
jgi:putative oxidoreductase